MSSATTTAASDATPPEAPAPAPPRTTKTKVGRLERSALQGVLVREIINFSSYWKGTTFSSTLEPTVYLLAFGFGFGSLVSQVGGLDYVQFVGTGTVATAVLFSSVFPSMFGTWVKYKFQHTYDAILAAPVDTEELVTGEALWIAARAAVFGCAPMFVAILFGLDVRFWMVAVPFINFVTGFGWSCFGICIAAFMKAMENFSYVTSGVITPIMLTAGTFFPIDRLPEWARVLAWFNPLHHCVELVRHAVFGWQGWVDLAHLGILVVFGIGLWRLAIYGMQRKLVS
jgi:lipooligosaccharide transport system permease protein